MLRFCTPRVLLAALALPLALTGCEATDPVPETASLGVEVEALVGTQPYSPGTTYTVNGRAMTFSAARLYLSNIRLVQEGGGEVRLTADTPVTLPAYDDAGTTVSYTANEPVVYAPLDLGGYEAALGEVPAGRYVGVRFDVGLAGTMNRVDASQAPAGHPLAVRTDLGNFWSWNSGYIFVRTEGRVDADGDGSVTGAADADWNVHLGTAGYVTPVELTEAFTVEGGATPALHLQVDLARLLGGVDLGDPAQRVCHTMNNVPVANAVRASAPSAFVFHGIHAD